MGNINLRLGLIIAMAMLFGCKKADDSATLKVSLSSSNYILIDAKAASCKSRNSTTSTDDVSAIYTDIGKFTIEWTPPKDTATLRIIYIKIYPRSGGLSSRDPKTIAGQDLNCIFGGGDINVEPVFPAVNKVIESNQNHIFGELTPTDSTKRSRFTGRADVYVYAILKVPGEPDKPITGRTEFNFQFDGAF